VALLSLPVTLARLTYRAATFPARTTLRLTVVVAEDLLEAMRGREDAPIEDPRSQSTVAEPPPTPVQTPAVAPVQPSIARRSHERRGASTPGIRAPREQAAGEHVDAGAVLVAESAERGAEEGAGAEIHVQPPWPGYGRLRAREVVDRLPAADDAALSVLMLYERDHRGRRSVIEAAQRELARRRPV
jgi:hypothetical protein